MHREFWLERWQNNEIGFHAGEINPYLIRYWPDLQIHGGSGVFVPLCGKSKDMLWLLAQDYEVVGVELSPVAISAFFSENGLVPEITEEDGFTVSRKQGLSLYCGDYFNLTGQQLGSVKAVYDRASLIALPPPMRAAYAAHLKNNLESGVKILLVAFLYNQEEMPGPPFSVPKPEIQALYGNWCEIRLLETKDILEEEPRFQARGLTRLEEQVYELTVK